MTSEVSFTLLLSMIQFSPKCNGISAKDNNKLFKVNRLRRWLQLRNSFDFHLTAIRPLFDSYSTAIRRRYDHSTTYVTAIGLPVCGLQQLHCDLNK